MRNLEELRKLDSDLKTAKLKKEHRVDDERDLILSNIDTERIRNLIEMREIIESVDGYFGSYGVYVKDLPHYCSSTHSISMFPSTKKRALVCKVELWSCHYIYLDLFEDLRVSCYYETNKVIEKNEDSVIEVYMLKLLYDHLDDIEAKCDECFDDAKTKLNQSIEKENKEAVYA